MQPLWEAVWRFLKKLQKELLYGPVIPLLAIYLKNICSPVFIAAIFTVVKKWKQPKCLSVDEWIRQLWYIYAIEYYPTIKRKNVLHFVKAWMDLEGIRLSEISQTEKDTYEVVLQWFVESNK